MADPETLENALDRYLTAKQEPDGTGNYHQQVQRIVGEWSDWLAEGGGDLKPKKVATPAPPDFDPVTHVMDVQIQHLVWYASHLAELVDMEALARSTATTYYSYVSAFLTWCVEDELLAENPAQTERAKRRLPGDSSNDDRPQFWPAADRMAIMEFVDRQVHNAEDSTVSPSIRESRLRDRTIVTLLASAGVYGAELFRDNVDGQWIGLRWADVDLEDGTLSIPGAPPEDEQIHLPRHAVRHLAEWKRASAPASDDWPVIPTKAQPPLFRAARKQLADQGYTDTEIDNLLTNQPGDEPFLSVYRKHGLVPRSLTISGARTIMKRLCETAGVNLGYEYDYLTVHDGHQRSGDMLSGEDRDGS